LKATNAKSPLTAIDGKGGPGDIGTLLCRLPTKAAEELNWKSALEPRRNVS